ncbi:hypothetical protein K1719_039192 [Acacia pycnantha]|nr:hypothetical protein K1719_046688 [Acacia pycnantha]KAI9078851.1 hypothetical protein K1719_039192 [Acacia pycnantha]
MEFLTIFVDKALNPLVQPVGRQLRYLYNYGDNVVELKGRFKELLRKISSLGHQVEAEERNAQDIEDSFRQWLKEAESKIAEVCEFLTDERHQKTGRSHGFPNLKLRHQLGRKAKKMTSECYQNIRCCRISGFLVQFLISHIRKQQRLLFIIVVMNDSNQEMMS